MDECSPSDLADGAVPKSDSIYSIDIPNSLTIWKVKPRPLQTGDVNTINAFILNIFNICILFYTVLSIYRICHVFERIGT